MACESDEDNDLESLRSAVLASLKPKSNQETPTHVSEYLSKPDNPPHESDSKDVLDTENGHKEAEREEEEDLGEEALHALRIAALKSKKDDALPEEPLPPPPKFERQGNLISIQIVDPEKEAQKLREEAKKKEVEGSSGDTKAAKPARFRRFDSDSEEDQSDSSSSSSESDSSDSESEKSSTSTKSSSSASSSDEEGDESKEEGGDEKQIDGGGDRTMTTDNKNQENVKALDSDQWQVTDAVGEDDGSNTDTKNTEDKEAMQIDKPDKPHTGRLSVKERLGVKGRLGVRTEDSKEKERREDKDSRLSQTRHTESGRSERERNIDQKNRDTKIRDLRYRLGPSKHSKERQRKEKRGQRERDGHNRDGRDRRKERIRTSEERKLREKRRKRFESMRVVRDQRLKNKECLQTDKTDQKTGVILKRSGSEDKKDLIKERSKSESLSDISLSDEGKKEVDTGEDEKDSDSEDVRFRHSRSDKVSRDNSHPQVTSTKSRLVMSLTLPTDEEMRRIDEKNAKDFKDRRKREERNNGHVVRMNSGKIQLGGGDHSRNYMERKIHRTEEKLRWRKARPSDFVSESESDSERVPVGPKSVLGPGKDGDAQTHDRQDKNSAKKVKIKIRTSKKSRNSSEESDQSEEEIREPSKTKKEKKKKKEKLKSEPEKEKRKKKKGDKKKKKSIQDRLGAKVGITVLNSSLKSRLGPKVAVKEDFEDVELDDVSQEDNGDTKGERTVNIRLEGLEKVRSELKTKEKGSDYDKKIPDILTKPGDLRQHMKRKLSKRNSDEEESSNHKKKKKIVRNNVWGEVIKERSWVEGTKREQYREEKNKEPNRSLEKLKESRDSDSEEKKRKERKEKDKELDERIRKIKEKNKAILERQKQIEREKEMFGS